MVLVDQKRCGASLLDDLCWLLARRHSGGPVGSLQQCQRPMLERTTLQLFRDCLRTAHHIGGDSAKGRALKQVVKEGFRKHIGVTDAAEISKLKADAVRALSNYLVMKSLNKSKK